MILLCLEFNVLHKCSMFSLSKYPLCSVDLVYLNTQHSNLLLYHYFIYDYHLLNRRITEITLLTLIELMPTSRT